MFSVKGTRSTEPKSNLPGEKRVEKKVEKGVDILLLLLVMVLVRGWSQGYGGVGDGDCSRGCGVSRSSILSTISIGSRDSNFLWRWKAQIRIDLEDSAFLLFVTDEHAGSSSFLIGCLLMIACSSMSFASCFVIEMNSGVQHLSFGRFSRKRNFSIAD